MPTELVMPPGMTLQKWVDDDGETTKTTRQRLKTDLNSQYCYQGKRQDILNQAHSTMQTSFQTQI